MWIINFSSLLEDGVLKSSTNNKYILNIHIINITMIVCVCVCSNSNKHRKLKLHIYFGVIFSLLLIDLHKSDGRIKIKYL